MIVNLRPPIMKTQIIIRILKITLIRNKKMKHNLRMISSSSNNNPPNNNKTQVIRAKVYHQSVTQTIFKSRTKKVRLKIQAAKP